jgi:hypothetical protein
MKEIIIYETESYGGMEGRDLVTSRYETEEIAKQHAITNNWNSGYTLYKVKITFNGVITEEKEEIGRIPCGCDVKRMNYIANRLIELQEELTTHLNNNRIKETTRAKRVEECQRKIDDWTKDYNELKELTNM